MKEEIKTLTTIEHILHRSSMYIGAVSPSEKEIWILNDDDKLEFKRVSYTEGLLKICNEAIDNSIDVFIKSKWRGTPKISVTMTKDTFTCEDNGSGIPVKKNSDGNWIPYVATCIPLSGSNFNDEDRKSIGTNGIGIKAANIFSTKFECITCDGKGKLKIVSKNNLSETKITELTPTEKTGTKTSFSPDFSRFGVKEFREELQTIIKTRLKFLSWFYPKCNFTFNGEKLNIKSKDMASLFPTPSVVLSNSQAYVCVYPTDEPRVLSYVNGISLGRGGTHVNYIMDKIVDSIREKVSKKYKNIKPADIKNRLGIAVFFNDFSNCLFDSQTKETLTNSQTDITNYLTSIEFDLSKLTNKIIKEKDILSNITDIFQAKEDLAEKKAISKVKTKKEVDSEKYYPPVGKTKKKYLMITEGFSAFSGISPILGRKEIGYYMLRGKILNVLDLPPSKFLENQEVRELIQILGIDLANPISMEYDKVVILSDADQDGIAIAGLIISLFSKIAPKMLEEGRICRMETPLLIGLKGEKVEEYYFNFPEIPLRTDLTFKYLKGLGSWTKNRLDQVISKEGGMDKLIKPYEIDDDYKQSINNWFGKDSEERKNAIYGVEFHINKI